MKVSICWLKELVDLKIPLEEVIKMLPLRTIGVKEVTKDFFELDMKGYNRADLLSLRGVAYEIAALTNSTLKFEETNNFLWEDEKFPEIGTVNENKKLAPVYCLAKIEGLTVKKSPDEWINKLDDSGMRSVNNIADVTNLVMLEYGQPLHAFDAETVAGKIIVRTARKGEEIITLDNKKRILTEENLLIADGKKPIAIAGVMGGKDSEVSDKTRSILLEAAIFDPINIRGTASRHNLYSEASKRFQHGLTKKRLLQAFNAAIEMYQELGGRLTGVTLLGELEDEKKSIKVSSKKVDSLIGIDIITKQIEDSLTKLGFELSASASGEWDVTRPYFRLDVNIEEDVIEEVARMYGYEKIPAKELAGKAPEAVGQEVFESIYDLKSKLADIGVNEIQTYSFFSTAVLNNLNINKTNLVKLLNPMSAETEYLRNKIWSNLLEGTAKNIRNGIADVAIFEIGKVFSPEKGKMPKEENHLAIAISNDTPNPIEELIGIAKSLGLHLSGGNVNIQTSDTNFFHPTRFAVLEKDGKEVGFIAEIHPRIVNKFGIEQRVAILEIELTPL